MHALDMAPGEPDGVVTLPIDMTGASVAETALGPVLAEWDADQALTALYSEHYRSLVRMAAFLVRDTDTAEEVVQGSFVAMHQGWRRLRDSDKALSYLRQSIVNRSRSVLRHQTVANANGNTPEPPPEMPSADQGAILPLEHPAILAAVHELPARQREALVLRYYGDLSEAQIAAVMGISRRAAHSHTVQAIAALQAVLEEQM
jgi:RNA polymerase sigma-70 factor (sigma-E family)